MKYHELERLTAAGLDALASREPQPVIVMPSGSLEQHGPHLPLGTDALNSSAISREIARLTGAVLLPSIPYTWVGGTRSYPLAVNVPAQTSVDYAAAVIRNLYSWGFRKFVAVNCHGGAIASYRLLGRMMLEEGIRIMVLYGPSSPPADENPKRRIEGMDRETCTCLGAMHISGRKKDLKRIEQRIRECVEMFGEDRPSHAPEEAGILRRWANLGFDYTHECLHVSPTLRVSAAKGAGFIRSLARACLPYIKSYEEELDKEVAQ